MPARHERPRKMADSQTSTKRSKTDRGMRLFGTIIILLLVIGMIAWSIKIFFF